MDNQKPIVVVKSTKNLGLALLLTILFGPLGLLYASISGGIILSLIALFLAAITFFVGGIGSAITYPIAIVWAYIATKRYNAKLMEE